MIKVYFLGYLVGKTKKAKNCEEAVTVFCDKFKVSREAVRAFEVKEASL